jgi:hypothetical protein
MIFFFRNDFQNILSFFLVIFNVFMATQIALTLTPKCAVRSLNKASGKSRT